MNFFIGCFKGSNLLQVGIIAALLLAAPVLAQPATRPAATQRSSAIPPELAGRTVEQIRIVAKPRALSSEDQAKILNQVRTREGAAFDPQTVEGDYQRIYALKKFANVEARVEPTNTGVIVVFEVVQQKEIKEIRFRGNDEVDTITLQQVVDLKPGEAIDQFRLSLARDSIVRVYQSKNFPHVHVEINQDELTKNGVVLFEVIEGPRVRVRKVKFLGNQTFGDSRLKDEVKTKAWFPLFVSGLFDPDQLEQDVAAVRQFYENHGFFDVRVGRKVVVGPDQKEVMIEFLIEEGQRYSVGKVSFRGVEGVPEQRLRKELKMTEGLFYNNDVVKRDIKQIVQVYSDANLGYIYIPQDPNPDPDYMRIREERYFKKDAGKVEIVYNVFEGKQFRLGAIKVRGNEKTQDRVIVREVRAESGELYNSSQINRTVDRLKALNLFSAVTITPIRTSPDDNNMRDLLIDVTEGSSAKFLVGAGVTSNAGLLGQISYEQRNFDITNLPSSSGELFSNRAFTGAGQTFRISLEPGTELTRATVSFYEPYLFDQPFSFGSTAYISQRVRENYDENHAGGRLSFGHRFSDIWSARITFRGEDVQIDNIENDADRAREILELEGHSTVTSAAIEIKRNTTDSLLLPSRGTITTGVWEHVGTFGGDFTFDKFNLEFNWFQSVYADLLDRKTILSARIDTGYISGDAPFFERYYAGGLGSVRGFRYRGISPRSGPDDDPIGGDFSMTGSLELSFPLAADILRGVVFADAGTVERDAEFGTIRTSAGFGVRMTLPFLGQIPIALDFGFPITKDDQDNTRIFSFSLGLVQ